MSSTEVTEKIMSVSVFRRKRFVLKLPNQEEDYANNQDSKKHKEFFILVHFAEN